jgi:hypothetical protein
MSETPEHRLITALMPVLIHASPCDIFDGVSIWESHGTIGLTTEYIRADLVAAKDDAIRELEAQVSALEEERNDLNMAKGRAEIAAAYDRAAGLVDIIAAGNQGEILRLPATSETVTLDEIAASIRALAADHRPALDAVVERATAELREARIAHYEWRLAQDRDGAA